MISHRGGVNISSKKDLFCILKILLQLSDHIADGNPSKSAKAGTVIKEYFETYATLSPDSWGDDFIQLWNAPSIKNYLKLQAIQNAVNKISKNIGSTINQSDENEEFNILIKWTTQITLRISQTARLPLKYMNSY